MHGNRFAVSLAYLGLAIFAFPPSQAAATTFFDAGAAVGNIPPANTSGKPVLDFVARSEDALSGSGPEGETYDLVPVDAPLGSKFEPEDVSDAPGFDAVQAAASKPAQPATKEMAAQSPQPAWLRAAEMLAQSNPPTNSVVSAPPAKSPAKAAPAKIPVPKPSAVAMAMKPSDLAGRYSLQRQAGKDASCFLILDDQNKAQGGYKASLAPGCRDEGIMIFDPVGWRLAHGRLVLIARRGHTTHLDLQPDGTWLKDPNEGKLLTLKKQ
jgi:hypothetical protein